MLPWEMTTPRGSAVVPEVKTICTMSSRVSGGGVAGTSERTAIRSRRVSRWIDGTSAIWFSDEHTQSLASTSWATRWAKSGAAILSIGTTITPRSRHPKNATTHSAQFAPDENFVTLGDFSRIQFASKTMRVGQHLAIRPALHPIAAMMDVGHFARVALKVVEVLQDGGACHLQPV